MTLEQEVASRLRALLDVIQSGEIEADGVEVAYLSGALDVLERLASSRTRP